MPENDSDLLLRAKRGDGEAFHALIDKYAQPLFATAYSLLGNRADAEDVLQETFAGAFRSLKNFEQRSSVKTWLTRILMNQSARFWRDQKPIRLHRLPEDGATNDSGIAVRSESVGVEARIDILAAIQKLSPEHRAVVVLREMEQMSYEEMALALGVPRGTVESRLHRARNELKKLLADYA